MQNIEKAYSFELRYAQSKARLRIAYSSCNLHVIGKGTFLPRSSIQVLIFNKEGCESFCAISCGNCECRMRESTPRECSIASSVSHATCPVSFRVIALSKLFLKEFRGLKHHTISL